MIENPLFSVIIPIYNLQNYLADSIESVINQSVGFKNNIELILVNDGSTDNSGKICKQYRDKYPDNIIYIEKENSGVCAARNTGFLIAKGQIINFFDGDDIWSKNAFKKANKFLKTNSDIDFCCCRLKYFEASKGYHYLDYKFKSGDRVIDIEKEPEAMIFHTNTCFFRKKAIENLKFDERLKISEDAKFVAQILLEKRKYGVLKSVIYNYRKRNSGNSAIDTSHYKKEWYVDLLKYYLQETVDLSNKLYSTVIRYVQNIIMYDLEWRVKVFPPENILDNDERNEYKKLIRNLLSYVEVEVIFKQKFIDFWYKYYLLQLKEERDIQNELEVKDDSLFFQNIKINRNPEFCTLSFFDFKFDKETVMLEGSIFSLNDIDKYNFSIMNQEGKKYEFKSLYDYKSLYWQTFESNKYKNYKYFNVELPLKLKNNKPAEYSFYVEVNGINYKLNCSSMKLSRFNFYSNVPFYKTNSHLIEYKDKKLVFKQLNFTSRIERVVLEIKYLKKLIKNEKKYFLVRLLIDLLKIFIKKDIWLISDRPYKAGDNGEFFFKWLIDNKVKEKCYFVIRDDCEDFHRLKKIGKVLPMNSMKYKIIFFLSKKIISSQAEDFVINPIGNKRYLMQDYYNADFIFLQHGIIKDDLSEWLNKFNKNIKTFVTSAKPEYDSILNYNYYYAKTVPVLTGLPRYENLDNSEVKNEKIIAIMPTWRKNLTFETNQKTGRRSYNQDFKNTNFYKFYTQLINEKKLLEVMKKKSYRGIFVLHPGFISQIYDFKGNDFFEIAKENVNYQELIKKSDILVTDYSSIAFDFAWLNKKIIYTQFDKETFFNGHTYSEGYFDYERDGFGPVTKDIDDCVDTIISFIDSKTNPYTNRIDDFFSKRNKNINEEIYNTIKN